MLSRRYFPWFERSGAFSWLKLVTLIALCAPALWVFYEYWTQTLGPKPVIAAVREVGSWGIRLFVLSLAITPLRFASGFAKLIQVRRMIGLAALFYLVLHFTLYILDQQGDLVKVASEIVLRFYLTIGFVALAGLVALGATSTDSIIKRMGGAAWNRLHSLVYVIAPLGLLHFFLQAKTEIYEATLLTGFFLVLMGDRQLRKWGAPKQGLAAPAWSLGVAVASAGLTALFQAGWLAVRNSIDPWLVLAANVDFEYIIQPAWWVLAGGVGLALIVTLRLRGWIGGPVRKPAARQAPLVQSAA